MPESLARIAVLRQGGAAIGGFAAARTKRIRFKIGDPVEP